MTTSTEAIKITVKNNTNADFIDEDNNNITPLIPK